MTKNLFPVFLFALIPLLAQAQPVAHKVSVYFDFGSATLSVEGSNYLDNLVTWLKVQKKPVEKIEITGHCDSIGNVSYNENLANSRAEKVKNYLVDKGVPVALLQKVIGYGKRMPLNDNADSTKRYLNRRVEVTVYFAAAALPPPVKPIPQKINATIDLSKMNADSIIILKNINFYPNHHYPLSESYPSIIALYHTLEQNPALKVQIRGFVCCLPATQEDGMDEDTYTQDLSTQRAKYIYGYLVLHGIDSTRLSYHGYGGLHPLVKEFTDEDRAINRRVEIKVLSK